MGHTRTAVSVFVDSNTLDSDQNIDALIIGTKWDTSVNNIITFSFTDSASDYLYNPPGTFSGAFSVTQQQAARDALAEFAGVADIVFSEQAFGSSSATLRFAEFSGISTAYGYYPNSGESGGDMGFNPTQYDNPTLGSYAFVTFLHEIGHAMGLKHGHETSGPGAMTADRDGMEFSIVTYNSFVGQNTSPGFYTNSTDNYAQTLMMYDIAAMQRLYGANFTENATNSVYTFNPTTGAMMINGVSQGTPAANVVFRTVWDGNGVDTYDLSNYVTNLALDLSPGGWSDFDVGGNAQRAQLNAGWDSSGTFVGSSAYEYARAHLFNALQYNGDARSLIENAKGGSGNDLITGNTGVNTLWGNSGNDSIFGGNANDRLFGNIGNDTLNGGLGGDRLFGGNDTDFIFGGKGNDRAYGGGGGDDINGGRGNDRAYGGSGTDTIVGSLGSDSLYGDNLSDTLFGGGGNDSLFGNKGNDQLFGGANNDRLYGGNNNDLLNGDAGADTVFGGAGADDFYFDRGDGKDRYMDFQNNLDTLQLDNFSYLTSVADALSFAVNQNGDVFFNFGADGTILIKNITKAQLTDDIEIL